MAFRGAQGLHIVAPFRRTNKSKQTDKLTNKGKKRFQFGQKRSVIESVSGMIGGW